MHVDADQQVSPFSCLTSKYTIGKGLSAHLRLAQGSTTLCADDPVLWIMDFGESSINKQTNSHTHTYQRREVHICTYTQNVDAYHLLSCFPMLLWNVKFNELVHNPIDRESSNQMPLRGLQSFYSKNFLDPPSCLFLVHHISPWS